MPKEKLMERARDELFSHINRCGVLQAEDEDQKTWMDETIEYIGERYPDLSDADLKDLYTVGMRFCKPAVRRAAASTPETATPPVAATEAARPEEAEAAEEATEDANAA